MAPGNRYLIQAGNLAVFVHIFIFEITGTKRAVSLPILDGCIVNFLVTLKLSQIAVPPGDIIPPVQCIVPPVEVGIGIPVSFQSGWLTSRIGDVCSDIVSRSEE